MESIEKELMTLTHLSDDELEKYRMFSEQELEAYCLELLSHSQNDSNNSTVLLQKEDLNDELKQTEGQYGASDQTNNLAAEILAFEKVQAEVKQKLESTPRSPDSTDLNLALLRDYFNHSTTAQSLLKRYAQYFSRLSLKYHRRIIPMLLNKQAVTNCVTKRLKKWNESSGFPMQVKKELEYTCDVLANILTKTPYIPYLFTTHINLSHVDRIIPTFFLIHPSALLKKIPSATWEYYFRAPNTRKARIHSIQNSGHINADLKKEILAVGAALTDTSVAITQEVHSSSRSRSTNHRKRVLDETRIAEEAPVIKKLSCNRI